MALYIPQIGPTIRNSVSSLFGSAFARREIGPELVWKDPKKPNVWRRSSKMPITTQTEILWMWGNSIDGVQLTDGETIWLGEEMTDWTIKRAGICKDSMSRIKEVIAKFCEKVASP